MQRFLGDFNFTGHDIVIRRLDLSLGVVAQRGIVKVLKVADAFGNAVINALSALEIAGDRILNELD